MDLIDRFLKYARICTTSSSISDRSPSTECQRDLAVILVEELKELGLEVYYDEEHCYVYGILKGNVDAPGIGFITHMDTSEDAPGKKINPQVVYGYDGKPIILKNGMVLDSNLFPDLKNHINKTLITSDGTSLLGADDKAGIAEVMTMLEYFATSNESHGDIAVCFTPDEEIGKDIDYFDYSKFPVKFAYTVDGLDLGEITYDNFNAASIFITIKGTICHLGQAKGVLVNSLTIANKLYSLIPDETPANSEGLEGYYHLLSMAGDELHTKMDFIIRDFDKENFQKRKRVFEDIVEQLNQEYGDRIDMKIVDTYYNMRETIDQNWHLVEKAEKAMKTLGVTSISSPIRGGTGGARLSFEGIPCPNLGTGGHNFHSYTEYVTLEDMLKTSEILIQIVKEYSCEKGSFTMKPKGRR